MFDSYLDDHAASEAITFNGGSGGDDVLEVLGDEAADAITATATTITVDGSTVTTDVSIEELNVLGLGGNDNINLTGFTGTVRVEIYAGDGNDTVRGSDQADIIYGGAGNDVLIGGIGDDTQYGEDGNDIFGNPTNAPNGVADDPGLVQLDLVPEHQTTGPVGAAVADREARDLAARSRNDDAAFDRERAYDRGAVGGGSESRQMVAKDHLSSLFREEEVMKKPLDADAHL